MGLNGGGLFRVVGGAESAFARITREIAAYYVLGIEPEPSRPRRQAAHHQGPRPRTERDGPQPAAIHPGSRRRLRRAGVGRADTWRHAVASGQTYRDLPVRVSTQTLRDLKGDHLRVLVRADIGRDVTGPADLRVGVAFFDQAGQLVGSANDVKRLIPTGGTDRILGVSGTGEPSSRAVHASFRRHGQRRPHRQRDASFRGETRIGRQGAAQRPARDRSGTSRGRSARLDCRRASQKSPALPPWSRCTRSACRRCRACRLPWEAAPTARPCSPCPAP